MNERDFKGVWIPKVVWLDNRLSALDKVILTEIDSLDQSERGCYASNKHIADFCQCGEWKVSTSISKLVEYGYLYIQNFDGRQREIKSCLGKFMEQVCENHKADLGKPRQSNTKNNTPNNTSKKRESTKKKPFIPPTLEEVQKYCESRNNTVDARKFFDYFNASDWVDSNGKEVRNWKQKIITWESYNGRKEANGNNGKADGDTKKTRVGHYL